MLGSGGGWERKIETTGRCSIFYKMRRNDHYVSSFEGGGRLK